MFPFLDMNPKSRVWIYQADKKLPDKTQKNIRIKLTEFTNQWRAHMKQLLASTDIVYDQFIFIVVDEVQAKATGCSIDSSVHLIMEIEKAEHISLLNRMLLAYRDATGKIQIIQRSEFSKAMKDNQITNQTIVFDNTIQFVDELSRWEIPVEKSWHAEAFA